MSRLLGFRLGEDAIKEAKPWALSLIALTQFWADAMLGRHRSGP
jgi:hypothetical protein